MTIEFTGFNADSENFRSANALTREGLETCIERVDPLVATKVLSSARRIGRIYSKGDITQLNPFLIIEEMGYLGSDLEYNDALTCSRLPAQMQLAFEPSIETFSQTTWRTTNLHKWYDEQDYLDALREHVLWTLCWKVDFSDFTKPQAAELVMVRVFGFMKYLPKQVMADSNNLEFTLEDWDLVPDPLALLPEPFLERKEDAEELMGHIQRLTEDERSVFEKVFQGIVLTPKEKAIASSVFDNDPYFASIKDRPQLPANRLRTEDGSRIAAKSGMSVFDGLDLGQVFWLIGNLTVRQRHAILLKLGYINGGDALQNGDVTYKAKKALINFREVLDGVKIPIYGGSFSKLVENTEGLFNQGGGRKNEDRIGRNHLLVKAYFESDPEKLSLYSGRHRSVAELVGKGLDVLEISQILSISTQSVYSYIHELAGSLQVPLDKRYYSLLQ